MTEEGQTLTERVRVALARVRDGGKRWRELIDVWDECVQRWGPESGPAKGALLDLVREAWGVRDLWRVNVDGPWAQPTGWLCEVWVRDYDRERDDDGPCLEFSGPTELAALVAALEETDAACSLCFDEGGAFGPCRQCHREAGGDIAPGCEAPGCSEPATGTADIGGATVWACGTVCLDSLVAALDDAPVK